MRIVYLEASATVDDAEVATRLGVNQNAIGDLANPTSIALTSECTDVRERA